MFTVSYHLLLHTNHFLCIGLYRVTDSLDPHFKWLSVNVVLQVLAVGMRGCRETSPVTLYEPSQSLIVFQLQ